MGEEAYGPSFKLQTTIPTSYMLKYWSIA